MNKIFLYFITFILTVVILPQQTSAASKIIFQDSFDDNDFSDWQINRNTQWNNPTQPCKNGSQNANWLIANGKLGIIINGPACITDIIPSNFQLNDTINYRYSVDIEYKNTANADRNIIFKYKTPTEWYGFHSYGSNLSFEKIINDYYRLEWLNYPFQANQTYHFDIDFIDDKITLYINNIKIEELEDTLPHFNEATIALSAGVGADPDSEVWFDNIVVTEINDDLDVPYYSQNIIPWGPTEYDHANQLGFETPFFERWGCAVTSAAMVFNYHKITEFADNTPITPGTLNEWIKNQKDGYLTGVDANGKNYSSINWSRVATLTKDLYEAEKAPVQLTHRQYRENLDPTLIEADLDKEWPVILRVRNNITSSHFVVAKGILENEQGRFSINDPEWNYQSLLSFNNDYFQIDRFIKHTFPLHENSFTTLNIPEVNYSYITIVVNGDVDLLVTNENDKKTGSVYQNSLREEFNEIPEASYSLDPAISNPDEFGNPESLGADVHVFMLPEPINGNYTVTLSGDETQNYSLNMSLMKNDGESLHERIDGVVIPEFERTVSFRYSQSENSTIEEHVTFQSTIEDVEKAIKMKLINKGIGKSMISQLKNAEKNVKKKKNFVAKIHMTVIERLLETSRGKKILIDEKAYQILIYDIRELNKNL